MTVTSKFRHALGFDKWIEYSIIAELLGKGLDTYVQLVDDKRN